MKKQTKKTITGGLIALVLLGMFLATLAPTVASRAAPKPGEEDINAIKINLVAGWNLLTVPAVNDFTAETLGQRIPGCTVICDYDAATKTYTTHVVGIPYNDFPIEDGVAYYVYVMEDTSFMLPRDEIEKVRVSIFEGYNFVGCYSQEPVSAAELGESIPGCTVICMFNHATGQWMTHVVGIPYNNYMIPPGTGVYAYSTVRSIWTGY